MISLTGYFFQVVDCARSRFNDTLHNRPLTGNVEVDEVANQLLEFIWRDFVENWYSRISSDPAFKNEAFNTFRTIALCISSRYLKFLHLPINYLLIFFKESNIHIHFC